MRTKRYERVVLNISGEVFETFGNTLKRFPETLLGDFDKRRRYFCLTSRQYFFNRSRLCFGAILYFYQSSGILSCPPGISIDVFEAECKFFEIPDGIISRMKTKEGIIAELQNSYQDDEEARTKLARCWDFLENPETSNGARMFAIFSLTAILLSILSACLETIKELRVKSQKLKDNPWSIAELVLNSWFFIELIARFIASPAKGKFLKSTLNWIDGFAVIPYFVILFFTSDKVTSLGFLRILRFIRVIRLFRLSKHSKRLKVVGEIIKSSFGDFQLLMLCLAMLIIFGGSLMYYIEGYQSTTDFTSIPMSLWWAIQTITTLGYGDIVPVTFLGQLLSACFMAFGALTISLPVLSIVTKFMTLYAKNIESDTLSL